MPSVSLTRPGLIFSLHPAARAAYEWLERYPRLVDWSALPACFTDALLVQPLQGVMRYKMKTSEKGTTRKIPLEFQLYAPLWPARYWPSNQPPAGTLLLYDEESALPSTEDIERSAWLSVLQLLVLSVNTNSVATLRDNLQELLPEPVLHSLFGKKKVSDADLCCWTGLSRGTLIQQRQRMRPDDTVAAEPADPLALLARPWSADGEDIL